MSADPRAALYRCRERRRAWKLKAPLPLNGKSPLVQKRGIPQVCKRLIGSLSESLKRLRVYVLMFLRTKCKECSLTTYYLPRVM